MLDHQLQPSSNDSVYCAKIEHPYLKYVRHTTNYIQQSDYWDDQQLKKFHSGQNSLYESWTSSGYLGVWWKSVHGRQRFPYGSQTSNTRAQCDPTTFWKQRTPGTLCVLGHTVHHSQFRFAHTKSRPALLASEQCVPTGSTCRWSRTLRSQCNTGVLSQ
jgi:hypothetical protein